MESDRCGCDSGSVTFLKKDEGVQPVWLSGKSVDL